MSTNRTPTEIRTHLQALVAQLLGAAPADLDPARPLAEIGVDSMVLLEAMRRVETQYHVTTTARQLFAEQASLDEWAKQIHSALQSSPAAPPPSTPTASIPPQADVDTAGASGMVARVLHEQLALVSQIVTQQLRVLAQLAPPAPVPTHITVATALAATNGQHIAPPDPQPIPLTPMQHWFFAKNNRDLHHWNIAELVLVPADIDLDALKRALVHVYARHDALHTRFQRSEAGWQQTRVAPEPHLPLWVIDLAHLPAPEQTLVINAQAIAAQHSLNLTSGPLLRLVYFAMGAEQPGRLLIAVHHLIADLSAWRRLLDDLQDSYAHLRNGAPLPPPPASFCSWAQRLAAYAQRGELRDELAYWTDPIRQTVPPLPRDHDHGPNQVESGRRIVMALSSSETQALLSAAPRAYQAQISDILLTALAQTLARWTGQQRALVHLRGHGRMEIFPDLDVSGTLGWFATVAPVLLELPGSAEPAQQVAQIQQQLRAVPQQGFHYGLLRYLCDDPQVRERLAALPKADITFNYVGHVSRTGNGSLMAGPAPESRGPLMSPSSVRTDLLDVTALIRAGQLHTTWYYSVNAHREETVAQLAETYRACLRALLAPAALHHDGMHARVVEHA